MKLQLFAGITILFTTCFKPRLEPEKIKVWGSRPVFALRDVASEISYIPVKQPVGWAGNIYAYGPYILQMEIGKGIHILDNHNPANADRIGFITVNGCEQLSIKDGYLYTNSYSDLITIDISNLPKIKLESRVKNAYATWSHYPYEQPKDSGYYDCKSYIDSVVVDWVKDSIYANCYKN